MNTVYKLVAFENRYKHFTTSVAHSVELHIFPQDGAICHICIKSDNKPVYYVVVQPNLGQFWMYQADISYKHSY